MFSSRSMTKQKLIGGFFEMEQPAVLIKKSVAEHWGIPKDPTFGFANARSALAMLISIIQPSKAWLPAYVCHAVVEAFTINRVPVSYYAVGGLLEPDVDQLDVECQSGDVVLAINYFGRAPSNTFYDFVRKRSDLIFVEDCAQTIDSEQAAWGGFLLLSPRKVLGVADGGYVIPNGP